MRTLIPCFFALASVARCSVVPEAYSVVPENTFLEEDGGKGTTSLRRRRTKETVERSSIMTFAPTPPVDAQTACMVSFTKTNSNCQNVSIVPFETCVYDNSL